MKLANIELTPESPSYPGGAWHVEGMRNEGILLSCSSSSSSCFFDAKEDIVSSGIYYYESENITESILNFRRAAQLDFGEYDEEGTTTRGVQEVSRKNR